MKPFNVWFYVWSLIAALISGCASNLAITYHSDPPGATIYHPNGTSLGYAPVTLSYPVDEESRKSGYLTIAPPTAVWPSGATAHGNNGLRVDLMTPTKSYTFRRPSSTPGYESDAKFGLEVQKFQLQKSRDEQAAWERYYDELRRQQEQNQQNQQTYTHCLPDGGSGYNCYSQ